MTAEGEGEGRCRAAEGRSVGRSVGSRTENTERGLRVLVNRVSSPREITNSCVSFRAHPAPV